MRRIQKKQGANLTTRFHFHSYENGLQYRRMAVNSYRLVPMAAFYKTFLKDGTEAPGPFDWEEMID